MAVEYARSLGRSGSMTSIPDEIAIVSVCEHMKWSVDQYWDAPTWFLDSLHIKMREDADHNSQSS